MSCFEVYYDGGVKKMRPINSFKEYAAIRNSQKNRRNTKAARGGDSEAKKHMVQFCYSCLPNDDGTLKGTKRVSNSVGMDIDFTKDMPKKEFEAAFEIMKDNILDNAEKLHLLMLERSATKGLHLVFERHPDLSQEKNLEWAQKLLGVEFDKGAKDITRVFFTPTADPKDLFFCKDELFINEEGGEKKEEEGGVKKEEEGGVKKEDPNTAQPSELKERVGERLYNGLPYSHIVKEFLRQFNNGETPVEGNRNVMTFELAKALRSICDYNIDIMKQVIPRYDNFPEEEYVRTLQSALDEPRRGVSYKLQKVLEALYKNEKKMEGNVDFEAENELPPEMPKKLPYPLGLLSSKVPEMYKAAVCEAVFAPLSTYVHGVKFRYWDGVEHEPTFMSVLCAPMSIGKGCVRKPINIILEDLLKRDESNRAREAEWKVKTHRQSRKKTLGRQTSAYRCSSTTLQTPCLIREFTMPTKTGSAISIQVLTSLTLSKT